MCTLILPLSVFISVSLSLGSSVNWKVTPSLFVLNRLNDDQVRAGQSAA